MEEALLERARGLVSRRGRREPLQYVLGEAEFFDKITNAIPNGTHNVEFLGYIADPTELDKLMCGSALGLAPCRVVA